MDHGSEGENGVDDLTCHRNRREYTRVYALCRNVEHFGKRTDHAVSDHLQGQGLARLALDGRHADARDTAGYHELEPGEVGRHIEREAVPGHPLARMHTDRCDLAASRPDAGLARPTTRDNPDPGQRPNERFLDLAEVPVQILPVTLEVENRVPDKLAGTMEGHVASTLDLKELGAPRSQQFRRGQEMILARGAA